VGEVEIVLLHVQQSAATLSHRERDAAVRRFRSTIAGEGSMSVAQARRLRRTMTDVERKLWNVLRSRQLESYKFRRQHPIGPYVVDFFCEQLGLAIELDGDQHGDPSNIRKDDARTAWLNAQGVRVIRFWNEDIRGDINPALDLVLEALHAPPLPQPKYRRIPPSS